MFSKISALLFILAPCVIAAGAVFPAWQEMKDANRWNRNSSGDLKISFDKKEQALRFDVTFKPGVDKWVYPQFKTIGRETYHGTTGISFDIKILPQGKPISCSGANVRCEGWIPFEPPAPGVWKHLSLRFPAADRGATPFFAIGVNPKTPVFSYLVKNIVFEGTPQERQAPPSIAVDAPGGVFAENAPLTFRSTVRLPGLNYTVKDWRGKVLQSGSWPDGGGTPLELKTLPVGYYVVSTVNSSPKTRLRDFPFAVVVDPAKRVFDHDSFFGVDAALSWVARPGNFDCPYYDGDSYRLVADLIRLAGIPHVRERLSWSGVNPDPKEEEIDFGFYLRNADLLRERNILISGMFHDAPVWSDVLTRLPGNLAAVYSFTRKAGEAFGNRMGNWEFWNEQDLNSAPEPVWDYAAALKAASLGFRAGSPSCIIANGAFSSGADNPYVHAMFDNDIAKYTNVYNFHTYLPIGQYKGVYEANRRLLKKYGIEERALWCTECGTEVEGYAKSESVRKGYKAHSPEQELILAEFYTKSQIEHQFNGGARNYPFVLPPFTERNGTKDWGMMRMDGTVKPAYAALAAMTAQLIPSKILGEISVGDKVRVFLFERPDGTQTVIFWSRSGVDGDKSESAEITPDLENDFELRLPAGEYTLTDLVGTPSRLAVGKAGKTVLRASRYPAYLAGLEGLKATVPARPAGKAQFYTPPAGEDLTVVIRVDLDRSDFTIGNRKSVAEMPRSTGKLKLQIWNIDSVPKSGRLIVENAVLEGLPETIELPAMGKAEFDVVLNPAYTPGKFDTQLVITGLFNGKQSTRFVMPVYLLGRFLETCREVDFELEKPANWLRNDSADQCKISCDEAERAVKFELVWENDNDRWFYPEHPLKLPKESMVGAKCIQFEVKTLQDKVENDFFTQLLMLVDDQGKALYILYSPPLHTWETRRIMLAGSDIVPETIKMFRIGCNPKGKKLTFWIRNVKLLFDK